MYKFLPVLALAALVAALFTYTPIKRELFYSLGISGDTTNSCCDEEEVANSKGEFDENAGIAMFNNELIDYPKTSLAQANTLAQDPDSNVLGTMNAYGEEKWIEVSLSQQKLRAWEGNRIVKEFAISSGKWFATPKGTYHIWYKTRNQKMEGGSKALGTSYYNLPNVPHNMFFHKGYAIHGAYWHNNFGTPMSHGCVNSPLPNVADLFEWAGPVVPQGVGAVKATAQNPGTKVFIH
jgi:hypothetical protein